MEDAVNVVLFRIKSFDLKLSAQVCAAKKAEKSRNV
jgi:hypothetical protein